ncbi:MAG: UvrD-helicase domain-containing protein, partial [Planctomycetaceae bacterium]
MTSHRPSDAVEPPSEPDILIRASAGTGKTYRLAIRYIKLLYDGAEPEYILATTFTRKAAGEILNRVLTRLSNAVLDEEERDTLCGDLACESLDAGRCAEMLRAMISQLHRLQICTLDSFYSRLATTFSLELGLPIVWSMVDESQQEELRNRAIENLLQRGPIDDSVQLASLLAKGRADRSVNALLHDVIKELYSIYQQTDEAAWTAVSAPQRLSNDSLALLVEKLETVERPSKDSWSKAINKDVDRVRMRDWQALVKGGIAAKILQGDDSYFGSRIEGEVRDVYQQLIRQARAELVGQVVGQTRATWSLLNDFDELYEDIKLNTGTLRFDDITHALGRLAEAFDAGRLAYRLDSRLQHLLLDEFQDTSLEQWRVLQPFACRVNRPGAGQSFFCVGDTKQAIYGWRGGVAEIFDDLEQELDGLQVESMNLSYRSSPIVIDTINRVFGNLTTHPRLENLAEPVAAWQATFEQHHAYHVDRPGHVRLIVAPLPETEEAATDQDGDQQATAGGRSKKSGKPRVSKPIQQQTTLKFAAGYIADIVADAPGRSVGVLTRSNDVVARLMFELRLRGVPASEEGGNPLTDSAAVQCVMSALRLADHAGDTIARFHLVHSPLGTLLGLERVEDETAAVACSRHIRRELMNKGYGQTLEAWYLGIRDRGTSRDNARLQQLVQLGYEFQPHATLRTSTFLKRIEAQSISAPSVDPVRVMTIHQAKGLQFDVVILAELESGIGGSAPTCVVGRPRPTAHADSVIRYCSKEIQQLLPPALRTSFQEAEARRVRENFCVMYVAMTRAVHALHMIIAPSASAKQKTSSGILCATLAADKCVSPEQVLYESGDPTWAQQLEPVENAAPKPTVAIGRVELAAMDSPRRRSLRRTAPSSLEGASRVAGSQLFGTHSAAALRRGTLIHHWCEHVEWLQPDKPDLDTLRSLAQTQHASSQEIENGLEDWQEIARGTDPTDPDTDDGGQCDGPKGVVGFCRAGPDPCPFDSNNYCYKRVPAGGSPRDYDADND